MLSVAIALVLAQPQTQAMGFRLRNTPLSVDFAFFEFAPASGAGMGSACACTTPTGAKGEALTFTRTGDATCSKQGLATTGIANGDLVVCTANQPRVESSGGVLGLRVEGARTNGTIRSQQIDNAAWLPQGAGAAIPVVTADQAVAPDGTTTADRVVIAACPAGGNYSIVQGSGSVQTNASTSLYVRGNGSSGNLGIVINSVGGPNGFVSCAYTSASWTRCTLSASGAAATTQLIFGCGNAILGMTQTGAADVFVWGAQMEEGTYATSPIPTVASAVTRNAETAEVALPVGVTILSAAVSFQTSAFRSSGRPTPLAFEFEAAGSNYWYIYGPTTGYPASIGFDQSAPLNAALSSNTIAAGQLSRMAVAHVPNVSWTGILNGVSTVDTVGVITTGRTTAAGAKVAIGSYPDFADYQVDGIVSQVCIDSNPARCR
jgi:hypothetical protein